MYTRKNWWCSIDVPRLNPASDCVSHVWWSSGLTWAWIVQPRGANGFFLYLRGLWKCAKADILGATFDWRRKFKVSSVGPMRWHHSESENLLTMPARIEMKCTLSVWIVHSAWLHWWLPRGASLYCICYSGMHCLKASKALLSNVCFLSPRPANFIGFIIFLYALINSSFDLLCIGKKKCSLCQGGLPPWCICCPCWEVNGIAPICSVWIDLERSSMRKDAPWVLVSGMWWNGEFLPSILILTSRFLWFFPMLFASLIGCLGVGLLSALLLLCPSWGSSGWRVSPSVLAMLHSFHCGQRQ